MKPPAPVTTAIFFIRLTGLTVKLVQLLLDLKSELSEVYDFGNVFCRSFVGEASPEFSDSEINKTADGLEIFCRDSDVTTEFILRRLPHRVV